MKILDKCYEYKLLENKLNKKVLNKIDKVLIHYENYLRKEYKKDINFNNDITLYYHKYWNGYVIDWYEGLMSTEELIEEINYSNYKVSEVK